jgi:hypothetical protein
MQKHVQNSALTFCWWLILTNVLALWREILALCDAGCRACLPKPVSGCRGNSLWGLCHSAYDDDLMNAVLGVDGEAQFTAYIATLGETCLIDLF